MKYTVPIICNNVWFDYSKELVDNAPTVKENIEKQKLVNELNELGEEEENDG